MNKRLEVDPVALSLANRCLGDAVQDHGTTTNRHMGDFEDGVSRWRGAASSAALRDVTTQLQSRHAVHQEAASRHGHNVAAAGANYAAVDGTV